MVYLQKKKIKTTLQYDWFFKEDQTECVVRERYTNTNAIFAISLILETYLEKSSGSQTSQWKYMAIYLKN